MTPTDTPTMTPTDTPTITPTISPRGAQTVSAVAPMYFAIGGSILVVIVLTFLMMLRAKKMRQPTESDL